MCERCKARPQFRPPDWTLSQIRSSIPPKLLERSTTTGFLYFTRDVLMVLFAGVAVQVAHGYCMLDIHEANYLIWMLLRWGLWAAYWTFQSLAFTALWIIAHECGHGSFSPSPVVCDTTGFIVHSALGAPYYSWKFSHLHHHTFSGNIERDEHFIPDSRTSPMIPSPHSKWEVFLDAIEDSPIYQLVLLTIRQLIGFQLYIAFNASGQPHYPWLTSHFNPRSVIFKPRQFKGVILSDIGILSLVATLWKCSHLFGFGTVVRMYIVPWVLMSHWISMIVYLHHCDPQLPLYRSAEWTYVRGILTTMDREFLGWIGVFFLHNISHCHVVHHVDAKIPFYHAPEATECIKRVLGDDYNFCETPVFAALWSNYKNCRYVDRNDDVLFYKTKTGEQQRTFAAKDVPSI